MIMAICRQREAITIFAFYSVLRRVQSPLGAVHGNNIHLHGVMRNSKKAAVEGAWGHRELTGLQNRDVPMPIPYHPRVQSTRIDGIYL